jgi:hypothetical protein
MKEASMQGLMEKMHGYNHQERENVLVYKKQWISRKTRIISKIAW